MTAVTSMLALSVPPLVPPAHALWQVFRVENGLPSLTVFAILEDREGAFWFGTGAGLSRYDGLNWRTWTTLDGLPHNVIRAIAEDAAGGLWIATEAGLGRREGTSFRTITTDDGLVSNDVSDVLVDPAGDVWLGTDLGVSRLTGGSWLTYDDELPGDRHIRRVFRDHAGVLWFGTSEGLLRYDGATWSRIASAGVVDDIAEDSAGTLWLACESGLGRWDGQTFATLVADPYAPQVHQVLVDRSGFIWFTGTELFRYDPRWPPSGDFSVHVTDFQPPEGPPHGSSPGQCGTCLFATRLTQDRSGNLWVGTFHGLARFDGTRVATFAGAPQLELSAAFEDSRGDLWVGDPVGLQRYDGSAWQLVPEVTGLVRAIHEDRDGNLWVGCDFGNITDGGLFFRDHQSGAWSNRTAAMSPPMPQVFAITEGADGRVWVGGVGVARYDGGAWTRFGTADGLLDETVVAIAEDTDGALWFGTPLGASRFDGSSWTHLTPADGLIGGSVTAIQARAPGDLWFGTPEGVARRIGGQWQYFREGSGLPASPWVYAMLLDSAGGMWVATGGGLAFFDGARWRVFTENDGLSHRTVSALSENRRGQLWLATRYRLNRLEPDRVPPQTLVTSPPPAVSTATSLTISFAAAFGEIAAIEFATGLDGGPESAWTTLPSFVAFGLADGPHTFKVRARDGAGNEDSTPAIATFEIDATPPLPVIEQPAFGAAIQDSIAIVGRADDARFSNFRVEIRAVGDATWTMLARRETPVAWGVLAGLGTRQLADGDYELRLAVEDTLGLTGIAAVRIVVDNEPPFAHQTSPVRVTAALGGDVFTTRAEAHLYVPPHAFDTEAVVALAALDLAEVQASLPAGSSPAVAAYRLDWGSAPLRKPAALDLAAGGGPPRTLLHREGAGPWSPFGGTLDPASGRISAAINAPGDYAVVGDGVANVPAGASLSAISLTPRVFSPAGGLPHADIAIGFTLARASPASVRIYNRAGRLVREITNGTPMNAGANLVRWDGRNEAGALAVSGLYLVTVEALGQTRTQTLAVVP